jgi:hypothetical protein
MANENDRVKRDLADERSYFEGNDGDLTAGAVNFKLDLLALHGLLEHWIRFGFRSLGNIFVIGGIVGKNFVGDTLASGGVAIGEMEDDY